MFQCRHRPVYQLDRSGYGWIYPGKLNDAFLGHEKFYVTYETRRVIVTDGLSVTKGFKYRVGLYDLIFQVTLLGLLLALLAWGTDGGEVRNYLLRVLSLTGTRLTTVRDLVNSGILVWKKYNLRNQHRLILVVCKEIGVIFWRLREVKDDLLVNMLT